MQLYVSDRDSAVAPAVLEVDIPIKARPRWADVQVRLWHDAAETQHLEFRWIPGLKWEWTRTGQLLVRPPVRARVTLKNAGESAGLSRTSDGRVLVTVPNEQHAADLEFSWPGAADDEFAARLRVETPRWALSFENLAAPVWDAQAIEYPIEEFLKLGEPNLLIEARDVQWCNAYLQAELRCVAAGACRELQQLPIESSGRAGRWRISLSRAIDTVREFAKYEIEVALAIDFPCPGGKQTTALSLLVLSPPAPPAPEVATEISRCKSCTAAVDACPQDDLHDLWREVLCRFHGWSNRTIDQIAAELGHPPRVVQEAIMLAKRHYRIRDRDGLLMINRATLNQIKHDLASWYKEQHE